MAQIAFYTTFDSPRLRYVVRQIFEDWLGLSAVFFSSKYKFEQSELPKIAYGYSMPEHRGISIPSHKDILKTPTDIQCTGEAEHISFFPIEYSDKYSFSFDLFAMVFHLLARSEEYDKDVHHDSLGRFPVEASWAYQHSFLPYPIVDYWVSVLRKKMLAVFPQLRIRKSIYYLQSTIDIDYFWAYKERGLVRHARSIFKDIWEGDLANFNRRWLVLSDRVADPYFCFDRIHQLHQKRSIQYFVHVGNWGKYDRPNNWRRPAVQAAIRMLDERHSVGLHPSFKAFLFPKRLREEKSRLEKIMNRSVTASRQHFLCFQLPYTYRHLIQAGITDDHSMGYARLPGFRASTARSFRWYDLAAEKETELRIHPFTVMDGTLKKALGLSASAGFSYLQELRAQVRALNVPMTILWHNSSLSEMHGWQGWRDVYERFLRGEEDEGVEF